MADLEHGSQDEPKDTAESVAQADNIVSEEHTSPAEQPQYLKSDKEDFQGNSEFQKIQMDETGTPAVDQEHPDTNGAEADIRDSSPHDDEEEMSAEPNGDMGDN